MSIIIDGKGSGVRAEVTEDNKLSVSSVSEDKYVNAATKGLAFNINTEAVTYSGTGPFAESCLYVKNNETADVEMVGWFIGEENNRTGGNTSVPLLFEMFGNPTGTPTGNEASIVNRRIGAARQFKLDAISNPAGMNTMGSPLLYQYHYGGRAFGTVNFTLPPGQSILVTVAVPCDSLTLYTGFTGYVVG